MAAGPRLGNAGPVMDTATKIIRPEEFPAWRESTRASGKVWVATNGCFDLLHAGHVAYLEAARSLGDALLVGLTGIPASVN